MDFVTDLLCELKKLRKGFGLDDPSALTRIGPGLRLVAGVADGDTDGTTRTKVKTFLRQSATTLSAQEARAITLGFALDGSDGKRLESRLMRLALETGRDLRTVRRRLDATLQKVAEQSCASMSPDVLDRAAEPWHLERLGTHVRLGSPSSEIREVRRVVSHRNGLHEVVFSYSAGGQSADSAEMSIDVLRGGVRAAHERCSATRTRVHVELPRPVKRSEAHEVTLKIVARMSVPYYVCTPRYRCGRFDLTIDFSETSLPDRLWLVEDELPLEAGDPERARIPVHLDGTGRATVSFTHLSANRSYGLAWSAD
ncbi:hypothetical protein [Actinomadura sp. NEAU-AAG7]|uniref:hypothetical protein n=1 Tax=Actinomadura sp. NEAU-AAG7 TaxID=2839640 RepID=UPI001BE4097E|nr:hypothetical protein [Actinomadura sp. NEAU-AAG7]MBT2208726.1 hypothetical protein [Actinomadura sp. NEAU-AAG7]